MSGSVKVSFVQQDGAENGRPVRSTVAEWRCKEYIASHPTTDFSVTVHGSLTNPCIEVEFQDALLEQLPLLADLQNSTESSEQVSLPCSAWAVVSLLILLKGDVSVKQWFEGKPEQMDETLPASTLEVRSNRLPTNVFGVPSDYTSYTGSCLFAGVALSGVLKNHPVRHARRYHTIFQSQVADFLACKHVKDNIMEWLHSVTREVIESYRDSNRDKSVPYVLNDRIASLTKVLLHVPPACFKDAVESVACKHERLGIDDVTVDLPAPLLTRWILASIPNINLAETNLSPQQWSALTAAISQSPPGALRELTLSAFTSSDRLDLLGAGLRGQQMLEYMQVILPHAPCLNYLGLCNWVLEKEKLSSFEQMVCMIPSTLQCLQIKLCELPNRQRWPLSAKSRLFKAVAQIRGLKVLRIENWEKLVAEDADECTSPLLSLPDLTIIVDRINVGAPQFPSSLSFEENNFFET